MNYKNNCLVIPSSNVRVTVVFHLFPLFHFLVPLSLNSVSEVSERPIVTRAYIVPKVINQENSMMLSEAKTSRPRPRPVTRRYF